MRLFAWLERKYNEAAVCGTFGGLSSMGLIESKATTPEAQAAAVRALMGGPVEAVGTAPATPAPVAAVGDKPRGRKA
jgi:hypothetical protein